MLCSLATERRKPAVTTAAFNAGLRAATYPEVSSQCTACCNVDACTKYRAPCCTEGAARAPDRRDWEWRNQYSRACRSAKAEPLVLSSKPRKTGRQRI